MAKTVLTEEQLKAYITQYEVDQNANKSDKVIEEYN